MLPVNCGSHADYQEIKELHFTVPANAKRFYKQYFRTFILYTIGIPDVVSYSKKSRAYLFKNTFKKLFNITPLGYREQTFH